MPGRTQHGRKRASRISACAARLRKAAATITSGRISRDYVEELADELDRYAEESEPVRVAAD